MFYKTLFIFFFTLIISGCFPNQVNYEYGWVTKNIKGKILSEKNKIIPEKSFILVLEFFSRFIETSNDVTFYSPRAKIIYPDSYGNFNIYFDMRSSAIEIYFISPNYKIEHFKFQRQIGIGKINYQVKLLLQPNWREYFILNIVPLLENLILDTRYKLEPIHQLFLGDWIASQREKIK